MKRVMVVLALLAAAIPSYAADAKLHDEIAAMDRAMFDAFNAHDAAALMKLFSPDVEFYHDKDGLIGYAELQRGFATLFQRNDGLRRRLVPGSLEVYPIPNYGAVEVASHEFCHEEHGKTDCGTFKFVHVWQKKDGQWRVTRAISVDH